MQIDFSFKNVESSDAVKEHVTKRVEKIQKLLSYPVTFHVFLNGEKKEQTVEITCQVEHKPFAAQGKTKDNNLWDAIDEAAARLETQIKKDRDRKKGQQTAHLANRPGSEKLASDVDAVIPHREKKTVG